MAILYAPIIQQVPVFSDKIKVCFKHNPAVDTSTYSNLYLILKDMNSDLITTEAIQLTIDEDNANLATCNLPSGIMDGEFYKCQIAYTAEGSWSEVSITRYVANKPTISINGLNEEGILNLITNNVFTFNYIGSKDENLYQYRYTLIDNGTKEIVQTSGWQDFYLNGNNNFVLYEELKTAYPYTLKLEGITINGLLLEPVEYFITSGTIQECDFNGSYSVEATKKGYAQITINPENTNYKYQLLRKESGSNHLELIAEFQGELEWKDYSVAQGIKYEYLIRNINTNANNTIDKVTKTLSLNTVIIDFEDMYLSDAERMLTIKFNPQVSSIKNTILEQKTDTIGSQYPFFFRNGNVNYKEIPISGLISYHMDDQGLFMTTEEIAAAGSSEDWVRSTNLTPDNFTSERKFKMEVLDWLTNGKPKLFRSPAEGNYVVRLMNTSLSPNATVGRMLHTFSTTGYECMPTNYITMIENEVVKAPKLKQEIKEVIKGETYDGGIKDTLSSVIKSGKKYTDIVLQTTKITQGVTCIKLDNTTCYLTNTTFTTPTGAIYDSIEVPVEKGNPITLTYKEKQNISNNTTEFPEQNNVKLFTLYAGENGDGKPHSISDIDELTGYKITVIYSLIVEKSNEYENYDDNEYNLILNGQVINCSDGHFRSYSNFDFTNGTLLKGKGLQVTIYCNIVKEDK